MAIYRDRTDAGRRLAAELEAYGGRDDVTILALPRGGVPVAYEVALALHAPLDVFIVRKLGTPGRPELAMGAIASGGVRVINDEIVRALGITESTIERVSRQERQEMERREAAYRGGQPALDVKGRTVILIDDGLATGATMRAAVQAVRRREPKQVIVAVPTGAAEVCAEFKHIADKILCAAMPEPFYAVGASYQQFDQTSDDEVRQSLARAREMLAR